MAQCFELANFYLGFDGWTSSLKDTVRLEAQPSQNQGGGRGPTADERIIFRTEVWITVAGVGQSLSFRFLTHDKNNINDFF